MYIQQGTVEADKREAPSSNTELSFEVKFGRQYETPPFVQLSVMKLDMSGFLRRFPYKVQSKTGVADDTDWADVVTRYDCRIENLSSTGFTIRVNTWGGNIIYGIKVSWIAFGEVDETRYHTIRRLINGSKGEFSFTVEKGNSN